MPKFKDEELIDNFFSENLGRTQKESFFERAVQDKGFIKKFVDRLEIETKSS